MIPSPCAARRRHRSRVGRATRWSWTLALLLAAACSSSEAALSEAAQRGRGAYNEVCIACHSPNPNLPGSLGPAVAGSSLELLEARVLRGEYPPGYTPKAESNAMPAFPQLADRIEALHAFLAESAR